MRAKDFIFEYRRDITVQNWGQKLLAAGEKDRTIKAIAERGQNVLAYIITELEKADPTQHKEYVQWLAKQFVTGQAKFEDIVSRGADALAKFNEMKRRKQLQPAQADINRLTFAQVEDIALSYKPKEPVDVEKGEAAAFYEDNQIRIIVPKDQTAACYYGQGTKWCTAATSNNMFAHYSKSGPLYIILIKQPAYPGEKYQFSFAAKQYMNEKDSPVNIADLVIRFPQLQKVFQAEAKAHNILSLILSPEELKVKNEQFKALIPKLVVAETERFFEPRPDNMFEQIYSSLVKGLKVGPRTKMEIRDGLEEIFLTKKGVAELTKLTFEMLGKLFPDRLNDEDAIWEGSFDVIGNWVSESDINGLFEEIASRLGDEDIHMDMFHELTGYISSLIQVVGKKAAAELSTG